MEELSMLKDFFTNGWTLIFGGVALLIVFSVTCLLWYNFDTKHFQQELIKEAAPVENIGKKQPVLYTDGKPNSLTTTNENSKQYSRSQDTTYHKKRTLTKIPDTVLEKMFENADDTMKTSTELVRMSPHGLGAYPKIPEGYPYSNPFDEEMSLGHELIERVRIKLFAEQGFFAKSIGIDGNTGLVQTLTKDQLYISWDYTLDDQGQEVKYVSSLTALPSIAMKIHDNARIRDPNFKEGDLILESDIPKDILILSESEGINPYEYLNLPSNSIATNGGIHQ